ncbi:SEC-C metal-binding domain-containing protein [Photobacterium ganghwense]|uniref:SEC-C metal-binding domain-containing protein n=1 Tax=Photobacterium ganghwense TaxID=320778 RepID=UPI004057545D
MPMIPAFCDTCGTPFSSGIFIEHCAHVTLKGNRSGPCPNCGGMGSVPDGVFNILGNVIEILSAPSRTLEQLKKYTQIINEAKEDNLSTEQVKKRIDSELPELSGITQFLPKTRSDLYAFLSLILAALSYITTLVDNDDSVTSQQVEEIMEKSIQKLLQKEREAIKPKPNQFKPTRNSECTCGSGLKYKYCCGQLI